MKVLLYSEGESLLSQSGLGKAIKHQERALTQAGIDYTLDCSSAYDLLHINTYFLASYQLVRKCRLKGLPIVYHAHSTEEDFRNSFIGSNTFASAFKRWITHCYGQADAIITPTPYAKALLEGYGLKQPIYAVSNGVDLQDFQPIPQARDKFRVTYGYEAQDFIIMGIGLLIERKGILDFIALAERLPQYKFIWFGDTNANIIPHHVKQAIQEAPSNLYFAGYVDNAIIRLAMQACDVFIMPTFEETEGIPAIEACASRCPFIVRDIPVFSNWLEDGYNVHKAANVDEFQEKIEALAVGELADLTEQAYHVAEARDLSQIGQAYQAIYETLI